MSYNVKTVENEELNAVLKIWVDDNGESPREWDNLGTMICSHGRYSLGDKSFTVSDYENWNEVLRGEAGSRRDIIALPLYLYDHSGITMNTTGFHCQWDSGQVGWIFVTKEKVRKDFGVKRVTKKIEEKVLEVLRAEVSTYDQYISGEVYGFTIEDGDGMYVDSCGGFYGLDDGIECMKEHVEEKYHVLFDEVN